MRNNLNRQDAKTPRKHKEEKNIFYVFLIPLASWRLGGSIFRRWLPRVVRRVMVAVGTAVLAYLVCFPIARPVTLDVGGIGDRLTLTGVNGDERDAGITYRWTTTRAMFAIPGYGGVRAAHVTVTARSGRVDAARHPLTTGVPYTVEIGGTVDTLTTGAAWLPASANVTRAPGGDALSVTLQAARYPVEGDPRVLGVQVARVRIEPMATDWRAGALGGWSWGARLALLAAAVALVGPPRQGGWSGSGWLGGGVAAAIACLAVASPESRLFVPPLLVPASWGVLGVGAVVRGRGAFVWLGAGRVRVRRWAEGTDAPMRNPLTTLWAALDRRSVARLIVAVTVVVYVVGLLAVVTHMDFIGHADYADTAVRARNLVRGQGDTVDYVAQFYRTYAATITHPAEAWPPLLVWMTALAFRLGGVSTVAAKLPNVAVMAGLLALVAGIGAWRWGRRVGALAALTLAASRPFFAGALVPENDLVFTLLFACFAVALYAAWGEWDEPLILPRGHPQDAKGKRERIIYIPFLRVFLASCGCPLGSIGGSISGSWRLIPVNVLVGVTAGLLVLAKPSGAVLIGGAAGAALLMAWRQGRRVPWGSVCVAGGVAALVYAPWAVRNLVAFGAPFHTTETLDVWVLKYDPKQPTEGIYRVFAPNALPHPRELVGYGLDHFLAVQGREIARFGAGWTGGALVSGLVLALALVGIVIGAERRRGFGALLVGAFVPYTAFVLLYWHYEARYFLVFVPWLLLYAAAGIVWLTDVLIARAGVAGRIVGPVVAFALIAGMVAPGFAGIVAEAQTQTGGNETVAIARWIADNTPPDAVVMTRNPWEISWHSGRRAVMLPLGTADEIYAVMRQYHVTVLELDHINDQATIRDSIRPLYSWREQPGITHGHYNPDARGVASYLIYRVNPGALPGG